MSGCIPAVVRSVERSSARGTRGADGRKTCPLDSKNARKPARSSADVRILLIVRRRFGRPRPKSSWLGVADPDFVALAFGRFWLVAFLGVDLLADLLQGTADQPRHVHLGDPDLLGDLRLRQPLEEAQVKN